MQRLNFSFDVLPMSAISEVVCSVVGVDLSIPVVGLLDGTPGAISVAFAGFVGFLVLGRLIFAFYFLVALLLFEFLLLLAIKVSKNYSSSVGAENPGARGNFVRLDRLREFRFSFLMEEIESP